MKTTKFNVVTNDDDQIMLVESNTDEETFPVILDTYPIHYQIWKKNYLNKEIEENTHFNIDENLIEGEFYHLVACPIILNQIEHADTQI